MTSSRPRGLYLVRATRQREEVDEMAASMFFEEESGTTQAWIHPHNGYYAGDFSTRSQEVESCGARQ